MVEEDSPERIWVLVDKHGKILEKADLRKASLNSREVPVFTYWVNQASAEHQLTAIKEMSTVYCWNTWEFRVVMYYTLKN